MARTIPAQPLSVVVFVAVFAMFIVMPEPVRATLVTESEPNDNYTEATIVATGDTVDATQPPSDIDYFKVTIPETGTLKIKTITLAAEQDYRIRYFVYSDDGSTAIGSKYVKATNQDTFRLSLESGDYFVRVQPDEEGRYRYHVSYEEEARVPDDSEPNNLVGTALQLTVGDTITGRSRYWNPLRGALDDVDFYEFTIDDTGRLAIKTLPAYTGQECQIYYRLLSSDGSTQIRLLYNRSHDATTVNYYLEPGTYYLGVTGRWDNSNYDDGVNYKFRVRFHLEADVAGDQEPNDLFQDAIPIAPDEVVTGRVNYWRPALNGRDEEDLYRLSINSTGRLKVRTFPAVGEEDYRVLYSLFGHNEGGVPTVCRSGHIYALSENPFEVSLEAGEYYLRVKSSNTTGINYKFTAAFEKEELVVGDSEPNNLFTTASTIGTDTLLTGWLRYWNADQQGFDNLDYYSFHITDSCLLNIKTVPVEQGGDYRIRYVMYASDETLLLNSVNDAQANDTLTLGVGPGHYFLRISRNTASGGQGLNYMCSIGSALSQPLLLLPVDSASDLPVWNTFSWSAVQYAERYRLQIGTDPSFNDVVYDDSTHTECSASVDSLMNGSTYFWRVNAGNATGTGAWSSVCSFSTIPAVPGQVVLLHQDTIFDSQSIILAWKGQSVQTPCFCVEIYRDFTLDTVVSVDSVVQDTFYLCDGLEAGSDYWWRVKARNAAGWGPYSVIGTFSVKQPPIGARPGKGAPILSPLSQTSQTLRYCLPKASDVTIHVYNPVGRMIRALHIDNQGPGIHTIPFGSLVDSKGFYMLHFRAEVFTACTIISFLGE